MNDDKAVKEVAEKKYQSLYDSVIDNIPDYFGRMGIPAGLVEFTRQWGLFVENLKQANQLACDLRTSQDLVIERCAGSIQEKWPEAAATLRAHVDGISGEDWGELTRTLEAKTRELQAIRGAAESLADSVTAHVDSDSCEFCRVKAEKVLGLLQRSALEGK